MPARISGPSARSCRARRRENHRFQATRITALCAAIMIETPPLLASLHGEVLPALRVGGAAMPREGSGAAIRERRGAGVGAGVARKRGGDRVGRAHRARARGRVRYGLRHSGRVARSRRAAPRPELGVIGPRQRAAAGYFGVLALIAIGSGMGWIFMHKDRADHETEPQPVAAVSQAPIPAPPSAPLATQVAKAHPTGPHGQATMAPSIPVPLPHAVAAVADDPLRAAAAAVPEPAADLAAAPASNGEASTDNPY